MSDLLVKLRKDSSISGIVVSALGIIKMETLYHINSNPFPYSKRRPSTILVGSLASHTLFPVLLLCYLHMRAWRSIKEEERKKSGGGKGLVKIGRFSGSTGMLREVSQRYMLMNSSNKSQDEGG